ncbi:MAG: DUF2971 domain-containing protein [Pseudomonadota bacterium]|nr:DUF2971 domain-containing protein [Pseudomonadota bacterium]
MAVATSLFKYRDFSKTSLELLINKELWFAQPSSLNDPFECQMLLPEFLDSIWRHYPITDEKKRVIESYLTIQIEKMGICSLSQTRKNQLMWAHYADEHKGFCIGFDEAILKNTSDRFHSCLVEYSSDLPYKGVIERIKYYSNAPAGLPIEYQNSPHSIAADILSSISGTKYTNWKYEKEVRLLRPSHGALKFCPSAVVSIAFGLRMPERDKVTLKKLLSTPEWSHLLWFQAEKQPDKFGLDFKKI